MQFTSFIITALLMASSSVLAAPETSAKNPLLRRALCRGPSCISQCPDGTDYNCCARYIRDPCADHQKCEWADCVCQCKNLSTTYLCNANYFVDPCAPLPHSTSKAAEPTEIAEAA